LALFFMKKTYFSELLRRYLHDDLTEGEAWTVEQWYEARDMPRPAPPTATEEAATKAHMWCQVQARIRPRPATAWQAPSVRWAAAALVALGLSVALLAPERHLIVEAAKVSAAGAGLRFRTTGGWVTCANLASYPASVALSDGSTVRLQPGSRLRYPQQFAGPERQVTLTGEGFFQVFHDARRPFHVLTDQLETRVLGTSFTVRALPGQAEAAVLVRTGSVRVTPRPTPPVEKETARPAAIVLLPNQQVVYSSAVRELRRELVARPALLHPQPLTFDERPVTEVLASLQTAYSVPILYDGAALAGCTVSLAFGPETLFDKLDLLCKTLGASYERADEKIIFRSRGCHSE